MRQTDKITISIDPLELNDDTKFEINKLIKNMLKEKGLTVKSIRHYTVKDQEVKVGDEAYSRKTYPYGSGYITNPAGKVTKIKDGLAMIECNIMRSLDSFEIFNIEIPVSDLKIR